MRKFITIFCFFIIASNLCIAQNWLRIHDAMIDRAKIISINNKRTLFFQTFGLTGAPFIGCNDSTIFRTYKLNPVTNSTYKPYGSFLEPFMCTDFVITESCIFLRPDEFDVSNFDSSFVIKYFQRVSSNCSPPNIRKIITSTGYTTPGDTLSAKVIRVSPFDDSNIYSLINNYLFRSTDRGQTWSPVSGTPGNLRDVIFNPYDPDYVYLISSQNQSTMLISSNGGASFDLTSINFSSSSSLFFKSEDTLLTYNASNLYKSGNKGISWSFAGSGAGNFNCLELHPTLKNVYYAGFDDLGLYVSTNYGADFTLYNNTFASGNHVHAVLKARPDKDSIYVVTDRGVYVVYDQYVTKIIRTSSVIPVEFKLYNNYPNPFNPNTIIHYDIPSNVKGQTSNVRIIIFNSLGKEVAQLVNENLSAGSYSVEFNGTDYPSGIYFYKLETEDFHEVKKMILLK